MKPLVGVGLVGMGAVMVYGGITGRLAPMLAAIFVPSALTERGNESESFWGKMFGKVGSSPLHELVPIIPDVPGVPFI